MILRNRLLDSLLFTHIFIGLCASALTWGNASFAGLGKDAWPIVLLAFCGTIWVYNLHRTVGAWMTKRQDWPERFVFFYQFRKVNLVLSILTLVVLFCLIWFYLWPLVGLLIPPAAISLAYVAPTGNGKLIRNIPFLKIFLIALTWTWVSILLPHALSNQFGLFSVSFILIMAERFLFIFAITIPFDIRDVEQDQRESLDTIVKVVGPSKAKYLSIGILTAATLIGYILYANGTWQLNYWLLHILIIIYAGLLVYRVHSDRRDAYYSWGLDGSMLLLGMIEGLYFIL